LASGIKRVVVKMPKDPNVYPDVNGLRFLKDARSTLEVVVL